MAYPSGWVTNEAQANSYFTDERIITALWTALAAAAKEAAIINSYNRIYYHRDYYGMLPTYATATAAQLERLYRANCEMAYYLLEHLEDEDSRKGLQAQAVVEAGIVKE
jgi:hypothetical protein